MSSNASLQPPLPDIWTAAYADLVRIVRDMLPVLAIILALYVATLIGWFIVPLVATTPIGNIVLHYLLLVGCAYVAAPYYVALHRFVALDEVRWIPRRDSVGTDADVYAAWAAYSQLLLVAPLATAAICSELGNYRLGALLFLPLELASWGVLTRLATVLPLAALAPRQASLRHAWRQTRGLFWHVFFATTTPAIPAYVAMMVLLQAAANRTIAGVPWMLMALATLLVMQLLPLAAATRLYMRLRDRPSA